MKEAQIENDRIKKVVERKMLKAELKLEEETRTRLDFEMKINDLTNVNKSLDGH